MWAKVSTLLMSVGWPIQAMRARERRLVPRFAALVFQGFEEGGLLAEDVPAGRDEDRMSRFAPVPRTFLPSNPSAYAASIAV